LLTEPDNVVPIPAPGALPTASASQETGGRQTKRRAFLIAASVAALAVAGGATAWWQFHRATSYATDVGEQRLVRLRDGSTVELNSRSLVRVHFSDRERQVELIEGQALFHVAKDRARPFIVRSDALQVRAIGTQFDVNRKRSGTVVTVLEGRVAVSGAFRTTAVEPANPPPALSLGAGEQVTVTRKVVAQPVRTNVSAATAWTQHRLVFESAPLAEVAEEFNRYSPRALIVEDAASEPLRLSGVFSTDPDFLIRYLRERPDIAIRETATEIYITRN
jgi:transmembrane sensor